MRALKSISAILVLATSLLGVQSVFAASPSVQPTNDLKPVYPRRAMQRNIEGYVTVSFTIDDTGSVSDAKVIDSEPAKIFDKSAVSAIKKLKFPKGNAQNNVELRIQYKLS